MKKYTILFILSVALFLVGCSHNIARFSVATTGNLPMNNVEKGPTVEGKECIHFILGIPFGNKANRVSGAVSDALDNATNAGYPSDALVNVDILQSHWTILIYGQDCITATGQPIAIKHNASN